MTPATSLLPRRRGGILCVYMTKTLTMGEAARVKATSVMIEKSN